MYELLVVLLLLQATAQLIDVNSKKCSFFDSVNITDGVKFLNGSFLHDQILYPAEFVESFDYRYTNLSHIEAARIHYRGCICALKPCIKLCCPKHQFLDAQAKVCRDTFKKFPEHLPIYGTSGEHKFSNIFNNGEKFGAIYGRPCTESGYFITPQEYDSDEWRLLETGRLQLVGFKNYSKDEFCMAPMLPKNSTDFVVNPYICFSSFVKPEDYFYAYVELISVPFMLMTIIVYAGIAELRNCHGQCLISYLSALSVGYLASASIRIPRERDVILSPIACQLLGFTAYYFLLASFCWLHAISFDVWRTFSCSKGVRTKKSNQHFTIFSLYAWGLPMAFLIIAVIVQYNENIDDIYKTGIDGKYYCWLNTNLWIQLIYFFGPMFLILITNLFMFIRTALKIRIVQREMRAFISKSDSNKTFEKKRDQFQVFFRLFIIMGITWITEIVSMVVNMFSKDFGWVFYLTDICNALHGLLIFTLFVMKAKVRNLICKRFQVLRGAIRPRQNNSCQTNTSFLAADH